MRPLCRIAALAVFVLAAAAGTALADPTSAHPLAGTSWVLADVPRGPDVPAAGRRVKLGFDAEGAAGSVAGFAGCNNLGGRYRLDGSALSFERLWLTRKACGVERNELELAVVSRLRETRSWRFAGRRLELRDSSGAAILVWRRPYVGGQSTPNR